MTILKWIFYFRKDASVERVEFIYQLVAFTKWNIKLNKNVFRQYSLVSCSCFKSASLSSDLGSFVNFPIWTLHWSNLSLFSFLNQLHKTRICKFSLQFWYIFFFHRFHNFTKECTILIDFCKVHGHVSSAVNSSNRFEFSYWLLNFQNLPFFSIAMNSQSHSLL